MSQIQNFGTSGGGGGGTVSSLAGDDAIAVMPNGGGTINVLAENQAASFGIGLFVGSVGANTLSFEPLQDIVTTDDGTFTTIFSQALIPNSAIIVRAHVIGAKNDFSVYAAGFITGGARRAGGAATSTGAGALLESDYAGGNPPPAVQITTVGNNIVVQVRGVDPDTYNWTAQVLYQYVL